MESYTFNDSGNNPELFEISKTSGEILKTLQVNAKNTDWEALTNDGRISILVMLEIMTEAESILRFLKYRFKMTVYKTVISRKYHSITRSRPTTFLIIIKQILTRKQ